MTRIKVLLLAMSAAFPADGAFRIVGMNTSNRMSKRNRRTMSLTLGGGGSTSTALSLDPRVAKMVDDELYREMHLDEWKKERMQNDQAVLESKLPTEFEDADFAEPIFNKQLIRDRKLARNDPQAYCADRCLTTGYCEVFEEEFSFSAVEVMQFCEECVLSDGEEPCDVPSALLEDDSMQGTSSFNRLHP